VNVFLLVPDLQRKDKYIFAPSGARGHLHPQEVEEPCEEIFRLALLISQSPCAFTVRFGASIAWRASWTSRVRSVVSVRSAENINACPGLHP